jgi:hypothetical protein
MLKTNRLHKIYLNPELTPELTPCCKSRRKVAKNNVVKLQKSSTFPSVILRISFSYPKDKLRKSTRKVSEITATT